MPLISLGAGLSELGKNVAQTAQAYTLEAQKAEEQRKGLELADRLAGARESAGRAETHNYGMIQQAARIEAEKPERDERILASRSGRDLALRKEGREVGAGEAVSGILSGGKVGNGYAERVGGYEGGSKNGGMVANELGSGAYGPYQIMPPTYADIRKENPDLGLPEDIKAATKEQHRSAFDRFTAKNAETLQKAGIEATPANLYLAHRFGAGGAQALIKATDDKLLADVLPPEWQKQNPDMRGQTVAGFKRLADERMKGVTMESAAVTGTSGAAGTTDAMPKELRDAIAATARANPEKALQMLTEYHVKAMEERERGAARTAAALKPKEPPAEVQTAEWLRNATPEQRENYEATIKRNADLKRAESEKAIPQSVTKGMQENLTAIRQIDKTLTELDKKPGSVGGIGSVIASAVPGAGNLQNRYGDPEGAQLRALIADIGSLKIHDRSGAAVSATEFPRLKPFIPAISDDPKTVKTKLNNFRAEYENILSDTMNYYSKENGFKPYTPAEEYLKGGAAAAPAADIPAPADRVKGRAYQTPSGLRTWMGDGWLAPAEPR